MKQVLSMIPENKKAPKKFTAGKQKTVRPTYKLSVWPREKACCVHACNGSNQGERSSALYKPTEVLSVRSFWYELNATDRRQFIANRIEDVDTGGLDPTRRFYMDPPEVIAEGELKLAASKRCRRVCQTFFKWCVNVSFNGLYQPTSGTRQFLVAAKQLKERPARKAMHVIGWLQEFANYYQISPDNDYTYLPYANKSAVFNIYKDEWNEREGRGDCAKERYFLALWSLEPKLRHIRIRKYLRFAKCDDCVSFRARRDNTRDTKAREKIKKEEKEHHVFVTGERDSYYKRAGLGETAPRRYFSVIIDGSDNSQYWSPYFRERSSSTQSAWKVGLHVMGAIVHGRRAYAYTILDTCPLGSNVTIDILHRCMKAELDRTGTLPKIMFLQLDNTTRQCKSKFVLAWLQYLVQVGVFDEIYVSFLPKGHTHEDIDQFFSCVARYLRGHDCPSPRAFANCIRASYTFNMEKPIVEHLTHVANIRDWLEPYIGLTQRHKITGKEKNSDAPGWHQYHLRAHGDVADRNVRMRVREWCEKEGKSSQWVGLLPHEVDTSVFKGDPVTLAFLRREPFTTHPVTPILRKAKRQRTKVGDAAVADPVKRLESDIEKIIDQREIATVDAESLREAVAVLNAEDADDPLVFDWDTEMYQETWAKLHQEEKRAVEEKLDLALEDAGNTHRMGTVWAVRATFEQVRGWRKKKRKDIELFWVVLVVGNAYRNEQGAIRIPCRYYEASAEKTKDRTKEGLRTSQYKLGDVRAELTCRNLQLSVRLNVPTKAGFQKINFHDRKRLGHVATRWLENAKGVYDVEGEDEE
jgi:hypothetical protein